MTELRIDGPHSPDYTKEVASTLAEAVRVLNHATRSSDGLVNPADAYDLLAHVGGAAAGLEQLFRQTRTFLADELEAGRLRDTHGEDPASAVDIADTYMQAAAGSAGYLHEHCSSAQQALTNLATRSGEASPEGRSHP